ncbi:unnamed protein product [Rotaria socialis]|uniref:Uncharacterized protein n=1 Tax=Rotaria socialis TaxID=392032 RepID=A0A821QDD4_9BILA|nr:unnamed protein product [Rotaria socialis]CAF4819993.1 unnamed protein product [Rotaria socialis]
MERSDLTGVLSISIVGSANNGQTANSIFSGEPQSKTCLRGKLLRRSERIRERRAKEPSMGRQKRFSADTERDRKSRKLENKEGSKNRKKRDALRHRSRRERVESFLHVEMDRAIVSYGYLGRMDSKCRHCGALHFKCEIASGRKDEYKQCYHCGSVELPSLLPYPDEMKVLLQDADVDDRNFREHVRNYNSALTFASLAAQIVAPTTR